MPPCCCTSATRFRGEWTEKQAVLMLHAGCSCRHECRSPRCAPMRCRAATQVIHGGVGADTQVCRVRFEPADIVTGVRSCSLAQGSSLQTAACASPTQTGLDHACNLTGNTPAPLCSEPHAAANALPQPKRGAALQTAPQASQQRPTCKSAPEERLELRATGHAQVEALRGDERVGIEEVEVVGVDEVGEQLARKAVERAHDGQVELPAPVRGTVDHRVVLQRLHARGKGQQACSGGTRGR
jgi:hypothetical protein